MEQNNDHTQRMHKVQFRSSFKPETRDLKVERNLKEYEK